MATPSEEQSGQKAGWLSKEGKRLKGRSRRYLVLNGTTLSHHIKETGAATWQVDINEVRLSLGERPLQFIISAGGRSVAFFADSQDELLSWIQALKSASSILEDFYSMGRQLGKGSYGEVFLSTDKLTGDRYAAKVIHKNPNNRKQKKFIERERAIMTTVNHPNIVRTMDVFESPTKLTIVSEYMQGGELFDLIIASQYFTEAKARHIMRQILSGVRYLHMRSIVHRDIKPENVLCVGKTWPLEVKLTDFGLSNFLNDDPSRGDDAMLLSHVGTSYYIAPEIVGKTGYGPAVDVWACGVVLYIMLCGRFPFWGKTDIEYMRSLARGPCMEGEGWDEVSDEGKGFLRELLKLDPKERLTAEGALGHSWILTEEKQFNRRLSSVNGLAFLANKLKNRATPEGTGPPDGSRSGDDDDADGGGGGDDGGNDGAGDGEGGGGGGGGEDDGEQKKSDDSAAVTETVKADVVTKGGDAKGGSPTHVESSAVDDEDSEVFGSKC